MRSKKAVMNTIMSLLEELVAIASGFILPRLILSFFGSQYNGLTTSITQFLACAVLLRAGIGGATRAALYKPLAEKDKAQVDSIVKATNIFMQRIAGILIIAIIAFAAIYPFLIRNKFGWFFTFSLFVIIGASSFAESFFGITYLIVLQADQRLWFSSMLKIVCYVINTILTVILMYLGCSLHFVKLGSATIFVIYPILLNLYVVRHYNIDKNVEPNNMAIKQRWDAFWQQVAVFVMNNSGIIVLTIFSDMLEVSVYSVYNLVATGLKRLVTAFTNGLEAAFGNMIARNERKALEENFREIEWLMFSVSTIVYTSAALLILDFVRVYTFGIEDVDYIRPMFAYILILSQYFNGVRLPYQLVVQAAGHYKQTKKGAIAEPIISLLCSILLVIPFGITGVAMGMLLGTVFRTIQYSVYMSKNLIHRNVCSTLIHCICSCLECISISLLVNMIPFGETTGYLAWILKAIVISVISAMVVFLYSVLFYRKEISECIKKMKNVVMTISQIAERI